MMDRLLACSYATLALLALCSSTTALAPSAETSFAGRRQFFGVVGSGAVAAAAAVAVGINPDPASAAVAKTGPNSPFQGDYDDPNHPGCLRQVKVVGAPMRGDGTRSAYPVLEVTGYDGKDGEKMCTTRPTRADLWKVQGTVRSNTEAVIDFSAKGGPKNLAAKYENGGIVFPDGNKWTKVSGGTDDRRPVDMSTLTDGVKGS